MLMCGVGAKSVAHLMKFYLLQWEVMKVKFLMNSNMTLTVLNLHQKTSYILESGLGQIRTVIFLNRWLESVASEKAFSPTW